MLNGVKMRKEFIETGKIVGTHGIRGMVRIQPWCDSCEFLCDFKKLYINTFFIIVFSSSTDIVILLFIFGVCSYDTMR